MVGYANISQGSHIQKLNNDEYMVIPTGEVKQFQHAENRLGNIKSVRRSISKLRDLINCNVVDPQRCKWITLTYAENMTDNKRLMSDFGSFWKRFLRYSIKNQLPIPEYISVVEPQGRGAWHIHLILIYGCDAPFLDNNTVMEPLWKHGFTKTKSLNNVDNVGAYFSAYLADIPLDELDNLPDAEYIKSICKTEDKQFEDEKGFIKDKKFVKGGRLFLYPNGMNLYRTSRNISIPLEYPINKRQYYAIVSAYERDEKKASLGKLTFSSCTTVSDNGKVVNTINRYYFNTNAIELNGECKDGTCEYQSVS